MKEGELPAGPPRRRIPLLRVMWVLLPPASPRCHGRFTGQSDLRWLFVVTSIVSLALVLALAV